MGNSSIHSASFCSKRLIKESIISFRSLCSLYDGNFVASKMTELPCLLPTRTVPFLSRISPLVALTTLVETAAEPSSAYCSPFKICISKSSAPNATKAATSKNVTVRRRNELSFFFFSFIRLTLIFALPASKYSKSSLSFSGSVLNNTPVNIKNPQRKNEKALLCFFLL